MGRTSIGITKPRMASLCWILIGMLRSCHYINAFSYTLLSSRQQLPSNGLCQSNNIRTVLARQMSQVQPETSRFELVSTPNFRIPDNKSSASPFYVPKKADSKAESQIDDVVDEPPAIRRDTPRTKVPQPPKPPSIRRRRTRRVTSVKNNNQQASSKYIGKLCNHELLGRNEEYVLGREIQTLRNWEGVREDLEFQLDR